MFLRNMNIKPKAWGAAVALLVLSATLSGCVVAPGYGYGGYGGGYYGYGYAAPPVVVAPGPFFLGGWGRGRGDWR